MAQGMGMIQSGLFGASVVFGVLTILMVTNVASSYVMTGGQTLGEWTQDKIVGGIQGAV